MAFDSMEAIVLRRSNYKENDRILTLLSPQRGRVDVIARGCRKPTSPLLAASELFTMGEYVLFKGKGHVMITAFQLKDSFYPLRNDVTNLSHASLMLMAADALAQRDEPCEHLFILLARSLARLAYGEMDPRAVTTAYLLHLCALGGFKPRLNHCVSCERRLSDEDGWLNMEEGGVCCISCRAGTPHVMRIDAGQMNWLRQVLQVGIGKAEAVQDKPPLEPLIRYVQHHIDRKLPALL